MILRLTAALMTMCVMGTTWAADDFLEPQQAFKLAARSTAPDSVELLFVVAPGHYLYREAFRAEVVGGSVLPIDSALPSGDRHFDPNFEREVETYRGALLVRLNAPAGTGTLRISAQGCADKGLCYPPMLNHLRRLPDGAWQLIADDTQQPALGAATWPDLAPAKSPSERSQPELDVLAQLFLAAFLLLVTSRRT
jgi:thiol:disulfide interchange protein DsbD